MGKIGYFVPVRVEQKVWFLSVGRDCWRPLVLLPGGTWIIPSLSPDECDIQWPSPKKITKDGKIPLPSCQDCTILLCNTQPDSPKPQLPAAGSLVFAATFQNSCCCLPFSSIWFWMPAEKFLSELFSGLPFQSSRRSWHFQGIIHLICLMRCAPEMLVSLC